MRRVACLAAMKNSICTYLKKAIYFSWGEHFSFVVVSNSLTNIARRQCLRAGVRPPCPPRGNTARPCLAKPGRCSRMQKRGKERPDRGDCYLTCGRISSADYPVGWLVPGWGVRSSSSRAPVGARCTHRRQLAKRKKAVPGSARHGSRDVRGKGAPAGDRYLTCGRISSAGYLVALPPSV